MRIDDHFRIGSITKTFTATLLLILADEKKLGLDDPVSKYVNVGSQRRQDHAAHARRHDQRTAQLHRG